MVAMAELAQVAGGVVRKPADPKAALRHAAEGFEEMCLGQMLRDFTAGAIGETGGGAEAFATMLQDEYAKLITRNGGVGIAGQVFRTLLKAQGAG